MKATAIMIAVLLVLAMGDGINFSLMMQDRDSQSNQAQYPIVPTATVAAVPPMTTVGVSFTMLVVDDDGMMMIVDSMEKERRRRRRARRRGKVGRASTRWRDGMRSM